MPPLAHPLDVYTSPVTTRALRPGDLVCNEHARMSSGPLSMTMRLVISVQWSPHAKNAKVVTCYLGNNEIIENRYPEDWIWYRIT